MQCKRYQDFMKEYEFYRRFLWHYRKTGKTFIDLNFHPGRKIFESRVDLDRNKIDWRRVDEVYKSPLFEPDSIGIDYVKQGTLGDCYFISALSRVAKQPELVEKLFDKTADTILGKVHNSINIKCGAVVVYFHAFGRQTPVLIDTFLPFYKGTNELIFSKPSDKRYSAWFCLVEKAYAKLFGSFSNIIGGVFTSSIYSLFGYQPHDRYISDMMKEEKVTKKSPFDKIMEYKKQGGVMSCSVNSKFDKEKVKKFGLLGGHAYLISKVVEFKNSHFYRLRNPWGEFEWKGDYSDDSPLWTPELKEALNFKKEHNGTFWMIEKDFFTFYNHIFISRPIPIDWHAKTFTMEMWPGVGDGCEPESPEAQLDRKTNYAMKITENIPPTEKVPLFFLIERRSYLPDEVKVVNDQPSTYKMIFALSNGRKLSQQVLKTSTRFYLKCYDQISYYKIKVFGNSLLTVALQRLEKRNEYEECSIRVICKYKFDLYDIDSPHLLVEDNDNSGKLFKSVTKIHNVITQKERDSEKRFNLFWKLMKNNLNIGDHDFLRKKNDDNYKRDVAKIQKKDDFFEVEIGGVVFIKRKKPGGNKKILIEDDDKIIKKPKKDDDDDRIIRRPKKDDDDDKLIRRPKKDDDDDRIIRRPKKDDDDDRIIRRPKKDDDDKLIKKPKKDDDDDKLIKKPKKDDDDDKIIKKPKKDDDDDKIIKKPKKDDDGDGENIRKAKKLEPIRLADIRKMLKIKEIKDDDNPVKLDDVDNEENKVKKKEEELDKNKKRIQIEINNIADQQVQLQDEINKLEEAIEKEENDDAIARLQKKIEKRRNKLEELEDKINSLLNEDDENEIELMKTMKRKKHIVKIKTSQKDEPKSDDDITKEEESDDDHKDVKESKQKRKGIQKPKIIQITS